MATKLSDSDHSNFRARLNRLVSGAHQADARERAREESKSKVVARASTARTALTGAPPSSGAETATARPAGAVKAPKITETAGVPDAFEFGDEPTTPTPPAVTQPAAPKAPTTPTAPKAPTPQTTPSAPSSGIFKPLSTSSAQHVDLDVPGVPESFDFDDD